MRKIEIKNSAKDGVAEILLVGDLDSYDAVSLMNDLTINESPLVRIRINSYGGNVNSAHAIVSAMHAFYEQGGEIETINEAMAGSAAGWIFAFGTRGRRKILQFAQLFLHQPRFANGVGIDDLPVGDERRADLEQCYNGLVDIFTSATDLSAEKVRELMDNDSYISSDEAVTMGFADEIVKISNAPQLKSNLTPQQIVNATQAIKIDFTLAGEGDKPSNENMKKVAEILNLAEGAEEKEVAKAVEDVCAERDDLKTENEQLKTENEQLKAAAEKAKADEIDSAVDSIIENNGALKDRRDALVAMAKAGGVENLTHICATAIAKPEQIDNSIEEGSEHDDKESKENLSAEFKKMTREAREALKNSDRAKYNKMVKAYDAIN
ncbi:MAG: ATP-dependent Clp protease proteolytic subunit [Rikenellaceae bacterium]